MTLIDPLESRTLFAAGNLATRFGGGDGKATIRLTTHSYTTDIIDVAVDDKQRTLVAGLFHSKKQIGLTRLLPNGTVDTSFGVNGIATINNSSIDTGVSRFQITVDHNGKTLVLVGRTIYRVNESGGLDKTFDKDGSAAVPIVRYTTDVAVDAKNRPVISGTATGKTGDRGTVLRLGAKGGVDASFGDGGSYRRPVPIDKKRQIPGDSQADAVEVLDDGSVVAAGGVQYKRLRGDFVQGVDIWRLTPNGALDSTYGSGGVAHLTDSPNDGYRASRGFQAFDGRGGVFTEYDKDFTPEDDGVNVDPPQTVPGDLFTYTDPKGKTGESVRAVPSAISSAFPSATFSVAQDDDRMIVYSDAVPALYRLNADLTLDTSFVVSHTRFGSGFEELGSIIAGGNLLIVQPDRDVHSALTSTFSITAIEL